jgi:thiol:disulfide interchange protein
MEPYIEYIKGHPIIGILLLALAVAIVWSVVKQLLKSAVIVVVILLGALYFTDSEARKEWQESDWLKEAGAKAKAAGKLGKDALKKGKDLLELLPDEK